MCPDRLKQCGDRLGDRAMVTPNVKEPQQIQCIGNFDGGGIQLLAIDRLYRIETPGLQSALAVDTLPESEEGLVAQCEKWAAQRGEDLQLIVRPFDRRDGRRRRSSTTRA